MQLMDRDARAAELPLRVAVIGCGVMAREHAKAALQRPGRVTVVAVCDPSPQAYAAMAALFEAVGQPAPPNVPDLDHLLARYHDQLDLVLIATPHAVHFAQASAVLAAGLPVILEKPMVTTVEEARALVAAQHRAGRELIVAFNGSLSPRIRKAARLLQEGELGEILLIVGTIWEGWRTAYRGHWKQDPAVSGGGFFFDTGAHLLNTVADLAGQPIIEVAAWLDERGGPPGLEILGTVMARLQRGGLVSLAACGDTIRVCASEITVFCTQGIVRTDAWGRSLAVQRNGEETTHDVMQDEPHDVWDVAQAVLRHGQPNPCPPEAGLRMALFWEAIQRSAKQGGQPVVIQPD